MGFKNKPIPCVKITLFPQLHLDSSHSGEYKTQLWFGLLFLLQILACCAFCLFVCFLLSWSCSLYRWFSISIVYRPSLYKMYLWRKTGCSQINSLCILYLDNQRVLAFISEEIVTLRDLARFVKYKNKIFHSNNTSSSEYSWTQYRIPTTWAHRAHSSVTESCSQRTKHGKSYGSICHETYVLKSHLGVWLWALPGIPQLEKATWFSDVLSYNSCQIQSAQGSNPGIS